MGAFVSGNPPAFASNNHDIFFMTMRSKLIITVIIVDDNQSSCILCTNSHDDNNACPLHLQLTLTEFLNCIYKKSSIDHVCDCMPGIVQGKSLNSFGGATMMCLNNTPKHSKGL